MIELDAVEVRHPRRTIGPVTARIPAGLTHLAGPSGAGKTTLLRLLCGERRCVFGSVRVDGRDPFADADVRRGIGLLTTPPSLPGFFTVDEAWRWHASVRGAPGWDGRRWCEELALPADVRLSHASAGERQRAELLAAIAGDPPLLLLDEPFSHLDVHGRDALVGWLGQWRGEGRTVIITGHADLPIEVDRVWTPYTQAIRPG